MKDFLSRLKGWAQDRPLYVNAATLGLVVIAALLVRIGRLPGEWLEVWTANAATTELYLGATAAAAILAGLAGMVVVYGVTNRSPSFRLLRVDGGRSLGRNWTSASASGFLAAAMCLAAGGLDIIDEGEWAFWLFALGVLWLVHGAVRTLWLLRILIDAAARDDSIRHDRDHNVRVTEAGQFR